MCEPIVVSIIGDLFLLAAVGMHAPYLHGACPDRVEINIFSIRCIFGAIIQSLGGGQLYLLPSGGGHFIYIELAIAFSAEYQILAIGRPAMQIRRSFWRHLFGCAAFDRYGINDGPAELFYPAAQSQHLPVERNDMVIIVVRYGACVDG